MDKNLKQQIKEMVYFYIKTKSGQMFPRMVLSVNKEDLFYISEFRNKLYFYVVINYKETPKEKIEMEFVMNSPKKRIYFLRLGKFVMIFNQRLYHKDEKD